MGYNNEISDSQCAGMMYWPSDTILSARLFKLTKNLHQGSAASKTCLYYSFETNMNLLEICEIKP